MFPPLQLNQQFHSLCGHYNDALDQVLRIMSGKMSPVLFPKAAIGWYWLRANRDIKRFAAGEEQNEMLQITRACRAYRKLIDLKGNHTLRNL